MTTVPWHLLLPLAAAAIYAFSALLLKRGLGGGASMNQCFHLTNFAVGLVFAPLLLLEAGEPRWDQWGRPALVAAAFFAGTWLTFVSIRLGDVSVVTPLMGTKAIFVAIGMLALAGEMPRLALWIAAGLAAAGIFLMGARDFGKKVAGHGAAVGTALLSAAIFGVCDVMVRMWSKEFGAMTFLAVSSMGVGAISAALWLAQGRPALRLPPGTGRFILWGAGLVGGQSVLMGLALSYHEDATGINVAYASRGLWVIALVGLAGPLLGNHERSASGASFGWRAAGAVLLTAAILLAVIAQA